MSDPVVCPVCETPNAPDSSHCEVCGERLTPPEPGEELSPEENVAAAIAEESEAEFEGESVEELETADEGESFEEEEDVDSPQGDVAPAVMYSPLDGTAYPAGTPEFEEGFGPNGEELVSEPPEGAGAADAQLDADEAHDEGGFDEESSEDEFVETEGESDAEGESFEELPAEEPVDETSEQFQQLFQPRPKAGATAQPLPEPGVRAVPATLTVYVNRQPVHTHSIDTDETLIGRRDPVSDAYPDLDLSELEEATLVSRKHAYVFRQNRNYTLYVVSNAGTQVNADLLELGERRALDDGDIIVLAGSIAMKFDLPD